MEHNGEPPKCYGHNLPAKIYTSHKEANFGRQFYRCPKPIGDQKCGFFVWADGGNGSPETHTNASPPTPASNARASDQRHSEPPSTPTPVKRNNLDTDDERESSRKRSRIIEASLSQESSSHNPGGDHDSRMNNESNDSGWGAWGSSWPPTTPPRTHSGPYMVTSGVWGPFGFGGLQPRNMTTCPSSSQETLRDESAQPTALTPESIDDMIRKLQGVPEYVRKLDRKRNGAEKSRDAKSSKMVSLQEQVKSLENEVQKLKAREKQLEEVIAAYEHDV